MRLSADQAYAIDRAAATLPQPDRDPFRQRVGDLLQQHPVLGDGVVARVTRQAQQEFWHPPLMKSAGRPRSRYF